MKRDVFDTSLRNLSFQRNIFLFLTITLSVGVLVLTILQFFKNERTILIPPEVHEGFWVDRSNVSPSYVEQMGLYLSQLILTKNTDSSSSQREMLLKYVHPSFYGIVSKKLKEEEVKMAANGTSYAFFPHSVSAHPGRLEVEISGQRTTYLKDKKLSSKDESYTLYFSYQGGRLMLTGISSEEEKENG